MQSVAAGKPQAFVVGEIGGSQGRSARREVRGRGAQHAPRRHNLSRDGRGIVGPVDSKGDVDCVLLDLEARIRKHEVRLQPGMPRRELGKKRGDLAAAEFHRRADLEEPPRGRAARGHLGFDVAHISQQGPRAFVIEGAFLSQAEASGAALGEADAQTRLERR